MWELTPQSIKSFIDDRQIVLPRFQRKPTWNDKQMFDLALSFFNGFPLGTVVIKSDAETSKYLLDGRQRRQALRELRDPENVYGWARSTLKLSNRSTPPQIAVKFYEYVADYFGTEPFERELTADQSEPQPIAPEATEDQPDDEVGDPSATPFPTETEAEASRSAGDEVAAGIHQMLELLLIAHPLRTGSTQFTRRFDRIAGLFSRVPFAEVAPGGSASSVSSARLRKWILDWEADTPPSPEGFQPTMQEFVAQLEATGDLLPTGAPNRLNAEVAAVWPDIERSIRAVSLMEQRLTNTKIGVLEIQSVSHASERKIFELINSAGSPLTAAEILSARHAWNAPVQDADPAILDSAQALYDQMDIPLAQPLVRWDVAATFLDRLDAPIVFGKLGGRAGLAEAAAGSRFERRLTLGFKLMAGWYASAIDKNTISDLDRKAVAAGAPVPWSSTDLGGLILGAIRRATDQELFRLWAGWSQTIVGATSDAAALNFALLMGRDWDRKGRPTSGGQHNAFQKNARILLDRTVFEYVSGQWGGSGDSRIRRNLEDLARAPANDVFVPTSESEWSELLRQVTEEGRLRGADYTGRQDERVVLLLVYRNILRRMVLATSPVSGVPEYVVDHIIPQEAFASETVPARKRLMNHIGNLAPIPIDLNARKSSRFLQDVTDAADQDALSRYEDVPIADFPLYASTAAIENLVARRAPDLREDLIARRRSAILGE